MRVRGRGEWGRIGAGQAVRVDPLDEGPVKILDADHWAANLEDLLGTGPNPAELGAGLVMKASEAEAGSLAGGEEALIGAFVVVGLGTTSGEAEGIPHFGESLSLFAKVLVGQGLGHAVGVWAVGPQMISEGVRRLAGR